VLECPLLADKAAPGIEILSVKIKLKFHFRTVKETGLEYPPYAL
jgi:hypothetical protein